MTTGKQNGIRNYSRINKLSYETHDDTFHRTNERWTFEYLGKKYELIGKYVGIGERAEKKYSLNEIIDKR